MIMARSKSTFENMKYEIASQVGVNLKQGYKLRNIKDLNNFNGDIILTHGQQESLNKEIMVRTL